jgi:hypothetical protein
VTVWRPRPPRTFPRRLLPRWRSSLVVASATLAPDGVLVEAEVDGERIPQGRAGSRPGLGPAARTRPCPRT